MPTIELFKPANDPNTSRQVHAPGGYESVYFLAASSDGRTQVMAGFHYGYPLDRNYARLYLLYRAFPTRVPPPEPMQHESASLTISHDGRVRREFQRLHPHGPELVQEDNGCARLAISDVELVFRRSAADMCDPVDDGPHHVVITAPRCEVSGSIGSTRFEGFGCRDHRWGTRWLRETGGCGSGAMLKRDRTALIYTFGNRKYIRAAGAPTEPEVIREEPMLVEVIKPSIFASLLRRSGDR